MYSGCSGFTVAACTVCVQTCAHHMLMMIAAMRDNLWLMTGRLDLVPTQTQVLPLINDALENFQGLVRERVKIQIEVPPDSLCCMDLDRLKHVIHVPLANAVKYTKRGTVKVGSNRIISVPFPSWLYFWQCPAWPCCIFSAIFALRRCTLSCN